VDDTRLFTLVVFYFERRPDHVVRVRIHSKRERRTVALGPVVVVRGQHFDDFSRGNVLGQHRTVITEEFRSVVVDVLNDHREGRGRRFRRYAVVDGQDFHLKSDRNSSKNDERSSRSSRSRASDTDRSCTHRELNSNNIVHATLLACGRAV